MDGWGETIKKVSTKGLDIRCEKVFLKHALENFPKKRDERILLINEISNDPQRPTQ